MEIFCCSVGSPMSHEAHEADEHGQEGPEDDCRPREDDVVAGPEDDVVAAPAADPIEIMDPPPPPPPFAPDRAVLEGTVVKYEGKRIGRMALMHRDTPKECLSMYCDAHKCSIIARTTRLPAHDDILKWFELGLRIPAGKANQCIHKREWAPLIPAE